MARLLDTRLDVGVDHCATCKQPFTPSGCGTGYGTDPETNLRHCYACCGERDKERMIAEGKAVLYLTQSSEVDQMAMGCEKPKKWHVTNWPGSLKFKTYAPPKNFRHPFTRKAIIAYFRGPDGKEWSARSIGEHTEIAYCRRLKSA